MYDPCQNLHPGGVCHVHGLWHPHLGASVSMYWTLGAFCGHQSLLYSRWSQIIYFWATWMPSAPTLGIVDTCTWVSVARRKHTWVSVYLLFHPHTFPSTINRKLGQRFPSLHANYGWDPAGKPKHGASWKAEGYRVCITVVCVFRGKQNIIFDEIRWGSQNERCEEMHVDVVPCTAKSPVTKRTPMKQHSYEITFLCKACQFFNAELTN